MIRIALGALSLALVTTLWLARPAPVEAIVSVQVLTDRLEPAAGGILRLDDGTAPVTMRTDADGQSPWARVHARDELGLVLAERELPAGIALGVREEVPFPYRAEEGTDALLVQLSRTQPLAVPVKLTGDPDHCTQIVPPAGEFPHWRIAVPAGSTLDLAAHVGVLLDGEAVHELAAYHGTELGGSAGYVRGVDLVLPEVQLGEAGIVVGIALHGDVADDEATVDALVFREGPAKALRGLGLAVAPLTVQDGVLYAQVTGAVPAGHLLLAVRAGGDPALHVFQDAPPELPPLAGGSSIGGGSPVECLGEGSAAVADRPEQPDPSPGWTCAPPALDGDPCGPTAPAGEKSERTLVSRSPLVALAPGAESRLTRVDALRWKITSVLQPFDGAPLATGGGFVYGEDAEESSVDTHPARPGAHGRGAVARFFRFDLLCVRGYAFHTGAIESFDARGLGLAPCAATQTVDSLCRDVTDSENTCDRTP